MKNAITAHPRPFPGFLKCLLILSFFGTGLFSRPADAQLTQIFQENLKGSVIMTGNTMGRSGQNAAADGPGTWGSIRTFINDRNPGAPTNDGAVWGSFTTGDWAQNYSWAELDLASVGGTSVVAVYLLWAGSCQRDDNANAADNEDVEPFINDPVTFEYPVDGGTDVITVAPDTVSNQCALTKLNSYVAWADVTDAGPDWRDGMYGIGGVPGTQNYHTNNYAGWTLMVVHENSGQYLHQVTLWAGFRVDYNSVNAPPTQVSGFCYPDPTNADPGRLLVTGMEGDSQFAEDSFRVGNTATLTAADAISGNGHPLNNFFSSQITDRFGNYIDGAVNWTQVDHLLSAGDSGTGTTSGARQGWDIADVELGVSKFNEGDEDAYLLPYSVGDSYAIVAMAFDLTTDSANFEIQASTAWSPKTIYADASTGASDTVNFVVEIQNVGKHTATNVDFTHPLPANATAVSNFVYRLDSGTITPLSVTLNGLTTAGIPIPIDVPPGSFLRVGYTVTISDHLPENPISSIAGFNYNWTSCSQTHSGIVSSAPMTVDILYCGDGIASPGENAACDGAPPSCVGDTTSGDPDGDGVCNDLEATLKTDPDDGDTDNDGVSDGEENDFNLDTDTDGLINALDPDSDNDGILDGTEMGVTTATAPADTDLSAGNFVPDADPLTTTDPTKADTDNGGVSDGAEDTNLNGAVDLGETDPENAADDNPVAVIDTDNDGLPDALEILIGTDPDDGDTDNDGVADGDEPNYSVDTDGDSRINALDPDSDDDGILDGTEMGTTFLGLTADTDVSVFVPDADPATTTNPLLSDSDGGGVDDGVEDANRDGAVDSGETDPNNALDDQPLIDTESDSGVITDSDSDSDSGGISDTDVDTDTDTETRTDSETDEAVGPIIAYSVSGSGALFSCTAGGAGMSERSKSILGLLIELL